MEEKNYGTIIAWGIVGVFLLVGFFLLYHPFSNQTDVQTSTMNVGPTQPASVSPSQGSSEPDITDWKTYTNSQYNFTLEIPSDWNSQEYTSSPPRAGHIIAFSPDALPCSTCTYVRDGFFSVFIYDQKNNPDEYATFQQELQAVGRDPRVQPVTIGGKNAILYNNTVSIENQGVVYEFDLDKDNGNDPVTGSKIYQHAVASLSFTSLNFNY